MDPASWKPHTRQHGITACKATIQNIHSHENLNSCTNQIIIVHKFCYGQYAYGSPYLIHSAYCSLSLSLSLCLSPCIIPRVTEDTYCPSS